MAEGLGAEARVVRFGVFELDVRSGELQKAGTRITIQGQPLQVLSVLLEHPGELVTRDELRATQLDMDQTAAVTNPPATVASVSFTPVLARP